MAGHKLIRAPEFCFNGPHVVGTQQRDEDCGISRKGLKCREYQFVILLEKRSDEIATELAGFAKRVEAVDMIVQKGVRPMLDVDRAIREKVDITFSMEKHRQAWESLPFFISQYSYALKHTRKQLQAACVQNLGHFAAKWEGVNLTKEEDELFFEEEIDENLCVIEAAFQPFRQEFHQSLMFIEDIALDACLDGVDWTLPQNPEDRAEHEQMLKLRKVNPTTR
jgi:hypothetical protein